MSEDYTQNNAKPVKRYQVAAENGDATAQCCLGNYYLDRKGTPRDYIEAIKWYRKAAAQGVDEAHDKLGRCYQHIVGEFSDFLASHMSPIGDCRLLPFPKQTILYAIKWVAADCEAKSEAITDEVLSKRYSKIIPTTKMLLTTLARDWHEIEHGDQDAIAKLKGYDSFPNWALPLKDKYINEDKAASDAFKATTHVMVDQADYEKAKQEKATGGHPPIGAGGFLKSIGNFIFGTTRAKKFDTIVYDRFSVAYDSYDAAYNAIQPYTTRANHRYEISIARIRFEGDAYNEAVADYSDPADFASYTEDELNAHTTAMENLTTTFDALTAAFAAYDPADSIYASATALYKIDREIYQFSAEAYGRAVDCAFGTALENNLQATKDSFQVRLLEMRAANSNESNPAAVKSKAAVFKAKNDKDTSMAESLEQKAKTGKERAENFLIKAAQASHLLPLQ